MCPFHSVSAHCAVAAMCSTLKSLDSRQAIILGVIQIVTGILTSVWIKGVRAYYIAHYKVVTPEPYIDFGFWVGGVAAFGGVILLIAGIKRHFFFIVRCTNLHFCFSYKTKSFCYNSKIYVSF